MIHLRVHCKKKKIYFLFSSGTVKFCSNDPSRSSKLVSDGRVQKPCFLSDVLVLTLSKDPRLKR